MRKAEPWSAPFHSFQGLPGVVIKRRRGDEEFKVLKERLRSLGRMGGLYTCAADLKLNCLRLEI